MTTESTRQSGRDAGSTAPRRHPQRQLDCELGPPMPPDELMMLCMRTPPAARRETPFGEHRGAGSQTTASASYEKATLTTMACKIRSQQRRQVGTRVQQRHRSAERRSSRTSESHESPLNRRSRSRKDQGRTTKHPAEAKQGRLSAHAVIEAKDHREDHRRRGSPKTKSRSPKTKPFEGRGDRCGLAIPWWPTTETVRQLATSLASRRETKASRDARRSSETRIAKDEFEITEDQAPQGQGRSE